MPISERNVNCLFNVCSQIEAWKEQYGCGLIRFAAVLHEDTFKLHTAVITFLKRGDEQQEVILDYGNLVLIKEED